MHTALDEAEKYKNNNIADDQFNNQNIKSWMYQQLAKRKDREST